MRLILSILLYVQVGGMLGDAVDLNYKGRLSTFISGPESEAVQIFSPERVAAQQGWGGWKGEHVGKWLYAAAKAYERTGDPEMRQRLTSVADYLLSVQEPDGYLGCYRKERRYYQRPGPEEMVVDWDSWIQAYLIQGLSEVTVATGEGRYADAALRIAGRMRKAIFEEGIKLAQTGEHSGMVGTGALDALCDLYVLRPDPVVKDVIDDCIKEMDESPNLRLISSLAKGYDVSLIGDGKIYEMMRCMTGLAKAYRLFGDERLLIACLNGWESIRSYHLTPLGGPWGGINVCPEIFNRPSEWAPQEVTETCSVMAWLRFTWEMLDLTGEGRYASEIEKTVYNALMAARASDGHQWVYYVNTNGWFRKGQEWDCCWSSGMSAMECIPEYMYKADGRKLYVNIIAESEFRTDISGKKVIVSEVSDYASTAAAEYRFDSPDEGKTRIGRFSFSVHRPEWAGSYSVTLNGKPLKVKEGKGYLSVKRCWKRGDVLALVFPGEVRQIRKDSEYINGGQKNWNFSNWYIGKTTHHVCFQAGPVVFAKDIPDPSDSQYRVSMTKEDISNARLGKREDGTATLSVGDLTLIPVCSMPADSGEPCRSVWFRF